MSLANRRAEIEDRNVTINVLTVNGKSFTPVMFRQIPRRKLVDQNDLSMQGTPWGFVHYFWGNCVAGSHLHVVWLDAEGSMFRDCIYRIRARGAPVDPEWTAIYDKLAELPQLFIDGEHSDVHA